MAPSQAAPTVFSCRVSPSVVVLTVSSFQGVEISPKVEEVLTLLNAPGRSLKLVRPKALMDNCFRVMERLYCSCCKVLPGAGAGGQEARHLRLGQQEELAHSWACPLLPRVTGRFWKPRQALA